MAAEAVGSRHSRQKRKIQPGDERVRFLKYLQPPGLWGKKVRVLTRTGTGAKTIYSVAFVDGPIGGATEKKDVIGRMLSDEDPGPQPPPKKKPRKEKAPQALPPAQAAAAAVGAAHVGPVGALVPAPGPAQPALHVNDIESSDDEGGDVAVGEEGEDDVEGAAAGIGALLPGRKIRIAAHHGPIEWTVSERSARHGQSRPTRARVAGSGKVDQFRGPRSPEAADSNLRSSQPGKARAGKRH